MRSLQMKKIIANASLCVLLCAATAYKEQTNIYLTYKYQAFYLLECTQCSQKITEDILHKIYIKKGAITGI